MGRLKNLHQLGAGHTFSVKYQKLMDECGGRDYLRIIPSFADYLSYSCCRCGHQQTLQAEELNAIVGNAFRMAYAAQLQKKPSFNDVIASQLDSPGHANNQESRNNIRNKEAERNSSSKVWTKPLDGSKSIHCEPLAVDTDAEMNALSTVVTSYSRNLDQTNANIYPSSQQQQAPTKPESIPGLNSNHRRDNNLDFLSPASDDANSPTELNSYKRLLDKPPLIKRLAMGGSVGDDLCPLVSKEDRRPVSGGYVNEAVTDDNGVRIQKTNTETDDKRICENSPVTDDLKVKRISQISSSSSNCSSGPSPTDVSTSPPLPPERTDSLSVTEEQELRSAPWFQAGIPREIALEVLSQEPLGSFMVRESTTKSGCFALSLRVPRDFHSSGIAHYLILKTNNGYKIKGFTKDFSCLSSLITHHSVMPELLPCPLLLSRYNPTFTRGDSSHDFADIDSDPDYNTLADFRKMMADLNV